MDNLNTHSEHADQPQGQQENGLPLVVPTSQVLDSPMIGIGQQDTNLSPFWFSLEQHRLQLDQVLPLHNEQVWMSLQQEVAIRNATLLNLLTPDALIQTHEEIASLHIELQWNQVYLETALHDREQWMQLAAMSYGLNESLIGMPPPVQQETNSHVSSNELDAPGYEDEASSVARTEAETTKTNLICKVCNTVDACMLLLPCQHLCACKPCGVRLTACPTCGAVKGDAIEARFG